MDSKAQASATHPVPSPRRLRYESKVSTLTAPVACLLLSALSTPRTLGVHCDGANAGLRTGDAAVSTAAVATEHGRTPSKVQPAKGRFLIASRNLSDPNFSETVVLLLAYDARGAMGIVINRPTDVRLESALPDVEELRDRPDRVYLGGPVAGNLMLMLIRSATRPKSSEPIFADVYASGDRAALRQVLGKTGKMNRLRAYAGHAGWGAGQLDQEIARGDWYVTSADATAIFDTAAPAIWPKLIERFSGQWAHNETPLGVVGSSLNFQRVRREANEKPET